MTYYYTSGLILMSHFSIYQDSHYVGIAPTIYEIRGQIQENLHLRVTKSTAISRKF